MTLPAPSLNEPYRLERIRHAQGEPDSLDPTFSLGVVYLERPVRWVRERALGLVTGAAFAGDGERIFFASAPEGQRICMPRRLYTLRVADRETSTPASRTEALNRQAGAEAANEIQSTRMAWLSRGPVSPAGRDYAFVCAQTGGHSAVHRVALAGAESRVAITSDERASFLVDADGRHVLTAVTDYNATPDLWVTDHRGGGRTRRTALNEAFLSTRALPTVHALDFKSADGVPLQAWFIRSPRGKQARRLVSSTATVRRRLRVSPGSAGRATKP
jgi:dipeptidyl aminopeptidase/acylaminoacyl peptidase